MEAFERIIEIITPALDENSQIEVNKAEELLIAANFDFDDVGYTKENDPDYIINLFMDLDNGQGNVSIETLSNDEKIITCTNVKKKDVVSSKGITPLASEPSILVKEFDENACDEYNQKVIDLIKTQGEDGCIYLSKIGAELGKVPTGEKMIEYFKKFDQLFTADSLYVTLKDTKTYRPNAVNLESKNNTPKAQPAGEVRTVSIYHLIHFAHFANYRSTVKELAEMAQPDGWFILPEEEENRHWMVDMKFRSAFAMCVKEQIDGTSSDLTICPDSAQFNTRFKTPDGKSIIACFTFNKKRDQTNWQTWNFDKFITE